MSTTPPPIPKLESEDNHPSLPPAAASWTTYLVQDVPAELRKQRGMAVPLVMMNLTWFIKQAITVAFLGRLGELQLAGGALGFTFANVTGYSILTGLCGAMEPICGQAYGAQNYRLLHRTLFMATLLLLVATLPISILWLNISKILPLFGQQEDMVAMAQRYLLYLLPDLMVNAFLCPLKAYLSAQGINVPIMLSSTLAVIFHVPINILLIKAKGVEGVAITVWISDLLVTLLLAFYVLHMELRGREKWQEGGWWDQGIKEWRALLSLCGPCCLTTCLEWWCYEILVLLTGRLPNAKEAIGVLVIVINFDYLLFSVMLSLSVSASTRVSNELGANQPKNAYKSAYVSLITAAFSGCVGAMVMVAARGWWGSLFSHSKGVIKGVKKMMVLMAMIEVANFPLTVSGGIVRGTARPWLGTFASLGGFYLLALPLGSVLGFKAKLGLGGLFLGFLVGASTCLILLLVFISRIDWAKEAGKAQIRAAAGEEFLSDEGSV
ncbi:protein DETOXIFICATION 56 [Chenopodium quinoa]|uniref:protein DETOXIFICATION 56 n=1 Tax=Chenopodium quinoa TaxID=63459 RepID=UPI000B77158C|nr:protein DETOXIFICATION 56 [Chenopodium quinoa]